MKYYSLYIASSALLCLFLALPANASALLPENLIQNILNKDAVEIQLSNKTPSANQTITAELKTNNFSLDALEIVWMNNGQIMSHGKGEKKFTFTVGKIGEKTEIAGIVQKEDGELLVSRVSIVPTDLIINSEFKTYTPKFYKGRARHSAKSKVVLVAIPQIAKESGELYKDSELIYRWKRNGMSIQNGSGLGKSSITITGPGYLDSYLISVDVQNTSGYTLASRATLIKTEEPKIIFYEKKPLEGIVYSRAIKSDSSISGDEFSLLVEPFYFDTKKRNSANMEYKWFVEKTALPEQENQTELSFKAENILGKKLKISGSAFNTKNLVQSTNTSFKIKIGETQTSGFAL